MKIGMTSAFFAACLFVVFTLGPACASAENMKDGNGGDASLLKKPASENRASMEAMQIPSHDAQMNALVYVAAGAGPHPVVILLHGFPGNERNLDLAQDMRRAGWDVVYFNYRGAWGSSGDFSFSHGIEDVAAVITYMRQPANAKRLRLDPARIVLVGHSMGGFMAIQAASADPAIKGIATISAADMGGMFEQMSKQKSPQTALHDMSAGLAGEGMAPLSGCTPGGLAKELADHASAWAFQSNVDALKARPALVVTSDDGLSSANEAFANALRHAGDTQVATVHLATDHAYSDRRIELSHALLKWLEPLAK